MLRNPNQALFHITSLATRVKHPKNTTTFLKKKTGLIPLVETNSMSLINNEHTSSKSLVLSVTLCHI